MRAGPDNLITDVPGLRVGNAEDGPGRTGVTVVLAEDPAVASVLARAARAVPGALLAGLACGPALAAVAFVDVLLREIALSPRAALMIAVFAGGGFAGTVLAWIAAAALAGTRPASARFAAMLVAHTAATVIALTMLHRFVIRWQDPDPFRLTPGEIVTEIFGNVSSGYVVVVAGLPAILPLGLVVLFGAAAAFARRPHA